MTEKFFTATPHALARIPLSLTHPSFEVQKNTRKFSFKSFMAAAASNLSHFQWLLYVKKKRNCWERGEKNVAHIDGYRMKKTFLFLLIAVRGIRRYFSIINKTILIRLQTHTAYSWKLTCQNFFLSIHISSMQIHTHKIKAETCFSDYIIPRKAERKREKNGRGKWEESREEVNSKQNSRRNFFAVLNIEWGNGFMAITITFMYQDLLRQIVESITPHNNSHR